ncbi:MAG: ABC transporter permease [Aeromicrobium sp.]
MTSTSPTTIEPTGARRRRRLPRFGPDELFIPGVLVALVVFLSLNSDVFLRTGNVLNIAAAMSLLAIVTFGQTFVIAAGGFDLSIGSQVALHGAVGAIVMQHTDSILAGVAVALLSGVVFGAINGLLVIWLNASPFIITLGTLVIGSGLALVITDSRSVGGLPAGLATFGLDRPLGVPWIVWLMLACFLVAAFFLSVHTFGLKVLSTGGNREAARLAGINVDRVTVMTFVISGVFAAIGGLATTARLQSAQPTVGAQLELFAVAAVVLGGSALHGGRAAMSRSLMGVALISIIQNGLNLMGVEDAWQKVAVGLVFILAVAVDLLHRVVQWKGGRRTPKPATEPTQPVTQGTPVPAG